jgi:hypothetical protein
LKQIKICPDCSSEYFPHIENCVDCGSVLLFPEDIKSLQEERRRCKDRALEDAVVLREGDVKWIDELYHVLIESGISCMVTTDADCNKGCCGDKYRLMVSSQDGEKANERIEEYYAEIHPEIRASKEMMSQGKCPACSSPVEPEAVKCPDCGLTLFIVE